MLFLTENQFVTLIVASPCLTFAAAFSAGSWLFRDLIAHAE